MTRQPRRTPPRRPAASLDLPHRPEPRLRNSPRGPRCAVSHRVPRRTGRGESWMLPHSESSRIFLALRLGLRPVPPIGPSDFPQRCWWPLSQPSGATIASSGSGCLLPPAARWRDLPLRALGDQSGAAIRMNLSKSQLGVSVPQRNHRSIPWVSDSRGEVLTARIARGLGLCALLAHGTPCFDAR